MTAPVFTRSLDELRQASKSLCAAMGDLTKVDDLHVLLSQKLQDALRLAGSPVGAVALIEGEHGREVVHQLSLTAEQRQPKTGESTFPVAVCAPLSAELSDFASLVEAAGDGCTLTVEQNDVAKVWAGPMRLPEVRTIHVVALRLGGRMIGWLCFGFRDIERLASDRCLVLQFAAHQMTTAIELSRMAETTKRLALAEERVRAEYARGARLSRANDALQRTILGLSRTADPPVFLENVLTEALRATGSSNGSVSLLEEEGDQECVNTVVLLIEGKVLQSDAKQALGIERTPLGEPLRAHAARIDASDDGALCTPNAEFFSTEFRRHILAIGIQSIHTMALRIGGRMIGWVAAAYTDADPEDPDRVPLLRVLADHMTIAVELTRMAEQAKQAAVAREKARAEEDRGDRLAGANAALHRIINGLTLSDDLPSFLETVLLESLRAVGTGHGAVVLIEEDEGKQFVRHHAFLERGEVVPRSVLRQRGIERIPFIDALRVYIEHLDGQTNGTSSLPNEWPFPRQMTNELLRQGVRSINGVALRVGGRVIGCLGVGYLDSMPRSSGHMALLRLLADQMTIAVELTRMAEQAKVSAVAQSEAKIALLHADQLAEANQVLKRSLDLISEDTDVDHTLNRMLEVMSEQIDCADSALCFRVNETAAFDLKISHRKIQVHPAEDLAWPAALCPPPRSQFWLMLVDQRASIHLKATADLTEPTSPMQQWFKRSAVKGVLGVPLLQRGEVIGCFVFRFTQSVNFTRERLEFLQTLAHQATLAIQLDRLSIAAQEKSQHVATLAERSRIARDLHDTLAQGFTGILMHLQASQRTSDANSASGHINQALDAARVALVQARRSVHALRAIELVRADFVVALTGVLKTTFAGSLVTTEVTGEADFSTIAEAVENELLRIAQEAATNALKHGRASRFSARIVQVTDAIELHLSDDGIGFDTHVAQDGFGLLGIRERAARVFSQIRVTSNPGAGTTIVVSVPSSPPQLGQRLVRL